jgi:hypothetical protein
MPDLPSAAEAVIPDWTGFAGGLLTGVNEAIHLGIADEARLGVMGHSAGGTAVNRLITQTARFGAAVSAAGAADAASFFGQLRVDAGGAGEAYGLHNMEGQCGGPPWARPQAYVAASPIYALDRVETPLLLIHGTEDDAVGVEQAGEMFVGLRRLGKAATLLRYRRAKLVYPGEFLLAPQPMKDPHANRPTIKVVVEIDQVRLDFRFGLGAERRAFADVRHAPPPDAVYKGKRDINAVGRQHAVLKLQVGRGEKEFAPDTAPLRDHPFDAIWPPEHAARQIDATRLEQHSDHRRADAPTAHLHLGNFGGVKPELTADPFQHLDVAAPLVPEGEPLAQIDFTRPQSVNDVALNKIFGEQRRQLLVEFEHDDLLDAEQPQTFHFLIEGLKQRRRGFGFEHLPWVRVESDQRRGRADEQCALDDGSDDRLVA